MCSSVLCFQFRGKILYQREMFPPVPLAPRTSPRTPRRAASRPAPPVAIFLPPATAAAARAAARPSPARAGGGTGLLRPLRRHAPLSNTGINNPAKPGRGTGA